MTAAVAPAPRRGALVLLALGLCLVLALALGVAVGTIPLGPGDLWAALRGRGEATNVMVVRTLRLPRAILAALVGAGLAMAGAALQGAMRNALAEPYLLGVSGGAAVGAVLGVALGLAATLVPIAAFAGAITAVAVTFFVAHASGTRGDPRVLLMAGVIVGAFANAAIMIVLAGAPPDTVRDALWWMMGSVAGATWSQAAWLAVYTLAGGAVLVIRARDIDVLSLGEDTAAGLGVDVDRAGRSIFAFASLLAAATVAAAGLVGFVGLIVPHIVRRLGIHRHRGLLVGSALAGATLVVVADLAARVVRSPAELPLGAVTAVIGVPFFLLQLRRLT